MKYNDVTILTANTRDIIINKNELAARLKVSRNFENDLVTLCTDRLMDVITYKCAYIKTSIDLSQINQCDFGFMDVVSRNLYQNLLGCHQAFVMAVTTGIGVDRLLAKLNVTSQAEHFITDAVSSAAVESFCDYASNILQTEYNCRPRFSPGYGDVSLKTQKPLLDRLNASELLGITLNHSYLMTPVKSITAIMGVQS